MQMMQPFCWLNSVVAYCEMSLPQSFCTNTVSKCDEHIILSIILRIQPTDRLGKSDPTRMIRTERTKILPELTPEIIDLKFTRTKNDLYRTQLDPKSTRNWNQPDLTSNPNRTESCRPEMIRAKANPNRMTRLLGLTTDVYGMTEDTKYLWLYGYFLVFVLEANCPSLSLFGHLS